MIMKPIKVISTTEIFNNLRLHLTEIRAANLLLPSDRNPPAMSWLLRRNKGRVQPSETTEACAPSVTSSMASLTPSQLDLAIRDLLSINPPRNRWEEYCRGECVTN